MDGEENPLSLIVATRFYEAQDHLIVNLAIGMFTPPLGVNLFAACAVANINMEKMIPYLIQFVAVAVACLALVTFFPVISIGLRDLLY